MMTREMQGCMKQIGKYAKKIRWDDQWFNQLPMLTIRGGWVITESEVQNEILNNIRREITRKIFRNYILKKVEEIENDKHSNQ